MIKKLLYHYYRTCGRLCMQNYYRVIQNLSDHLNIEFDPVQVEEFMPFVKQYRRDGFNYMVKANAQKGINVVRQNGEVRAVNLN